MIRIAIVNADRPSIHISKAKNKKRTMGGDPAIHMCQTFMPEVRMNI